MECYFEPISKCSITDALMNTSISDIHVLRNIYMDINFETQLKVEAKGKLLVDIFKSLLKDSLQYISYHVISVTTQTVVLS